MKYDNNPLLLICNVDDEGIYWLKQITKEKIINDTNIQYNFRIQQVDNKEKFQVLKQKNSALINYYYPKVLDFTKSNSLSVQFFAQKEAKNIKGFTYNAGEGDLNCQDNEEVKTCEVNKEYFKGKKSGFYFVKYTNNEGKKLIVYEAAPIKVILESSSKGNIISLTLLYTFLLLLIMI